MVTRPHTIEPDVLLQIWRGCVFLSQQNALYKHHHSIPQFSWVVCRCWGVSVYVFGIPGRVRRMESDRNDWGPRTP